ncbi:hypothetical protein [Cytobacillus gottheilii]|uniref:hypothetical protein n=1 Tax=Cytobacillus gottheilii TaxID=859144 RepID=UPI0009B98CD7|nr:hypothetical protein [Cytobacillus gottheilii]
MAFESAVYPAFIKKNKEGFGVHFPTLYPETGWQHYKSLGKTKKEAIQNAKKDLAYFLAGIVYDYEELPSNAPIPANLVTQEMELVWITAVYRDYAKEIEEHLIGRHWHIDFNRDMNSEYKAVAYKNEQGVWEVRIDCHLPVEEKHLQKICPNYPLICLATRRAEAEEKFDRFVLKVEEILKK